MKNAHAPKAILATRIYDPEPAAASYRLKTLVEGLAAAGYDVDVLTSTYMNEPRVSREGTITVKRFPVLRGADGYIRGYLQYLSFDIPVFFRILFAGKADVVFNEPPPTTGLMALMASKIRRRPNVYVAADIWSDAVSGVGAPKIVSRLVTRMESLVLKHSTSVFSVSDGVDQRVAKLADRATVRLPFSVNTSIFHGGQPRPENAPEGPYFLYAGTASERHGATILLSSLKELHSDHPEAHLVFMGTGSDWAELERAAEESDRIWVIGRQPAEVVSAWMAHASACVATLKPGEGYDYAYPTKIFSSLACGTPVVFAGIGPAGEDILNHNQLGEAADYSVESLAHAMRSVLERSFDQQAIQRWVAQRYSSQAVQGAVERVLTTLKIKGQS